MVTAAATAAIQADKEYTVERNFLLLSITELSYLIASESASSGGLRSSIEPVPNPLELTVPIDANRSENPTWIVSNLVTSCPDNITLVRFININYHSRRW